VTDGPAKRHEGWADFSRAFVYTYSGIGFLVVSSLGKFSLEASMVGEHRERGGKRWASWDSDGRSGKAMSIVR
jgi:hypothetical protein